MIYASKIKNLYPYLQGILLLSGYIWFFLTPFYMGSRNYLLYLLLGFAIIAFVFRIFHLTKLLSHDKLYYTTQFIDAIFIAALIYLTGGIKSEFFLVFFPIVVLLSAFSGRNFAIVGALWYGVCFLVSVLAFNYSLYTLQLAILKLGAIWSAGLIAYFMSHFMRTSEKKMLKTLDILNERTWELESSQAQLSNIYETTRLLSGILNLEELLGEILNVARAIFRYQICHVYLSDRAGKGLYKHASLEKDNKHLYETPELYKRELDDIWRVNDAVSMMKFLNRGSEKEKSSLVDIPLISRGKVIGVLQILTEEGTLPNAREKRLMLVFANAAAVAIDNSLLHEKTQELTITDELTELYNFRYFKNKLADELRRADRYRQKLSILLLDLDFFKDINDTYGHQTGNLILKEVADIIKICVRDVDVVARYGGEEFVVILPQTDSAEATTIAERIRETIAKNYFSNNNGQREIQVTTSIGACTYPNGVHTINQLFEKVDQAMYRAKSSGRNRICFAEKSIRRDTDEVGAK